jgi:hypothetical protein
MCLQEPIEYRTATIWFHITQRRSIQKRYGGIVRDETMRTIQPLDRLRQLPARQSLAPSSHSMLGTAGLVVHVDQSG